MAQTGQHRSALVWTVAEKDAAGVLKLSDRAASWPKSTSGCTGVFGTIELASPVSSYPLGFQHTARITADRLALVGRCGARHPPDCRSGPEPRPARCRRAGRSAGGRDAARARSGRCPIAQALRTLAQSRQFHRRTGDRWADALVRDQGPHRVGHAPPRHGGQCSATPILKRFFMDEARGMSGDLPELLRA